jgi:hypothetical protein
MGNTYLPARSRIPPLRKHEGIQENLRVLDVLRDIRVGVEAVHLGGGDSREGVDVFLFAKKRDVSVVRPLV